MFSKFVVQSMFSKFAVFLTFFCYVYGEDLPNPADMIAAEGYPAETHWSTSEDGYITTLHRIPHGINSTTIGPPVYIAHGMGSSAAEFINYGPARGLAYILADAGYDVWLANARGNSYSMNHTTLDPKRDAKQFYDFSWHEIGRYDFPCNIDYILSKTGHQQVYFVSHSQGGTAYYVFLSMLPQYAQKIRYASLLAPSAIMQHENVLFNTLAALIDPLMLIGNTLQIYSFPFLEFLRPILRTLCPIEPDLCLLIMDQIVGYADHEQFDRRMFSTIFKTTPSAFPMKSLYHYGQLIKTGEFKPFDYGMAQNLIKYGSPTPPKYEFSKILAKTSIWYGKNDLLVNPQDIDITAPLLPNLAGKYLIDWPKFNHMDHLYAIDIVDLLYNYLLADMKNH